MTANAESWPVDCDLWFCRICGSLEKRESGRVESWRSARVRCGRVKSIKEVAMVAAMPVMSFALLAEGTGLYSMIKSVMTVFWMVRKKFSP